MSQSNFDWPPAFAPLSSRFKGYTWGKPLIPSSTHVFGISQLPTRWPTGSLEDLESAIFEPRGSDVAFGPVAPGLDHYLVIELLDAKTVRANLAMLVDSHDWFLLDEHIMQLQ
jgi:hypothetical protein